jgi:amidase
MSDLPHPVPTTSATTLPASILDRDTLGAFVRHTHAALDGANDGPLAGFAFGAKDLYDVAGQRTGFGSPDWLRTHPPATRTAAAVQRLLDAGATLVGRTHTDEIAWSILGENPHYGTPMNVAAPGRIPGGSSSGSAAAVAGRLVDFALGSDTGGSVRLPASFCGLYGLRPTWGRIPLDGACALAPSFDTAGWFARDPVLFERIGRVLLADAAEPVASPGPLFVAEDLFAWAGDAVSGALAPGLALVSRALAARTDLALLPEGPAAVAADFRVLQAAEAWAVHGAWIDAVQPALEPGVRERFAYARTVTPADAAAASARRDALRTRIDALLAGGGVIALPTAPGIAPLRGQPAAATEAFRQQCMGLTALSGLTGLPQVTLPFGTLDGCPIGLSLIAGRGRDATLLALVAVL